MKCKNCGNTKDFTMIKETGAWNAQDKKFESITDGQEYYVCDKCMMDNEEGGHIDTEGDY